MLSCCVKCPSALIRCAAVALTRPVVSHLEPGLNQRAAPFPAPRRPSSSGVYRSGCGRHDRRSLLTSRVDSRLALALGQRCVANIRDIKQCFGHQWRAAAPQLKTHNLQLWPRCRPRDRVGFRPSISSMLNGDL